jgi:SAM-dependent methyltransferase
MATTCPVDLDTMRLRAEIESIYRRVAIEPGGDFHFHRGPAYAAERLGYDAAALARLPAETPASFAGQAVGPDGRAIGVDMTEAMADRARAGARSLGLANVDVRLGDAMALPVESASVDVVISNGVLNLTPDKEQAFGEVFRVLKPGGQFLYGDIVVAAELSESIRRNIDLWTG